MNQDNRTRWERLTGGTGGEEYAARIAARIAVRAASGEDVHGEAALVHALAPTARVLDAGCGTGRVAIRLAELGHEVVGVDADPSMLAVARRNAPGLAWSTGDVSDPPPEVTAAAPYDLVLLAGNVVPLLTPGTLTGTLAGLARLLGPAGLLVAGLGLDAEHLPAGCEVTPLADHEAALAAAGLEPVQRLATWAGAPYDGGGYVVTVDRAPQ